MIGEGTVVNAAQVGSYVNIGEIPIKRTFFN